jgi:hypothetical protein
MPAQLQDTRQVGACERHNSPAMDAQGVPGRLVPRSCLLFHAALMKTSAPAGCCWLCLAAAARPLGAGGSLEKGPGGGGLLPVRPRCRRGLPAGTPAAPPPSLPLALPAANLA